MPFPFVRQHDAAQVGMIEEANPEEIEDFALVPVGAAPDTGDRFNRRLRAGQAALQPQTFVAFDGVKMIDQLKTRFSRLAIHGGDRAEADELLIVLQESADAGDLRGLNFQGEFAEAEFATRNGVGIEGFQRGSYGILFEVFR